jgi:hypothetical protein
LTPDADGPEVVVEAMASGAMVHPCEFFYFAFCKEMWLGTMQSVRKSFVSRQKNKTPFLTWTVVFFGD